MDRNVKTGCIQLVARGLGIVEAVTNGVALDKLRGMEVWWMLQDMEYQTRR